MTIALSANTPRVSYTVNQGATQTAFTVNFEFFDDADLNFYVDGTKKTISTHYTVSGGNGSTGTINTTSGNTVTGATGGSTVIITRDIGLARVTDFPSSGAFQVSTLNTELDRFTAIASDLNDKGARGIRLQDFDSAVSMELPLLASRKGTVLGFNASTGAVEAGPTITAVQSLSAVTASINLLGTSAVVEDMGLLATSTVIEDMGLLATSGNVTAMGLLGVSGVITDMGILGTTAIVEDMGFLGTSANVTAMGVLGTSANVTAMGKLGNDATVADMAILGTDAIVADMAILANSTIVDDLAILATSAIVDDMALLATTAVIEDMGLLATSAVIEDMGLLATSAVIEDMGLLATSAVIEDMGLLGVAGVIEDMGILGTSANVTAMSNVSGAIANVNTVASNVSGVNSFAQRYRVQSGVPSSSNDVGDLVFDTAANTLKVFGSSGFQNAGSSVNGTSARFHYDIGSAVTSVTGNDASGNALAYDAGFIDVYVNGVRMSTADVTVTSGDTVTFASALSSGDEVDIVCFGTFSLANFSASNLSSGTIASARISGSYTGITGTGALNAGTITSGFGNIDTGSSTITTTGAVTTGALSAKGGAVFNEDSADVDFRVESNGNANMLFVDGGNNRVGIGSASPVKLLDITESVSGDNGNVKLTYDGGDGNRAGFILKNTHTGGREYGIYVGNNATGGGLGNSLGISDNTASSAYRLLIDSAGRVTLPSQPAFRASPSAGVNLTSSAVMVFGDVSGNPDFNTGGHYNTSNGRFTCPVAGVYMFCFSAYKQTNQSGGDINININGGGAGEVRKFNSNANHETMEGTFIYKLVANDFVNLVNGSATLHLNAVNSHFSGFLIG